MGNLTVAVGLKPDLSLKSLKGAQIDKLRPAARETPLWDLLWPVRLVFVRLLTYVCIWYLTSAE